MSSDTVYDPMQERMEPNHYHGDYVRMLFIAAAVLLFVTQFTGDDLPFTPGTSLIIVVALVVAAGITNPAQRWVQWMNVVISVLGILLFGGIALARLHDGNALLSHGGFVALIALIFLGALYFSTRTLRAHISHLVEADIIEE